MKFSRKLTLIFSIIFLFFGTFVSFVVYFSNVNTLERKIKEELADHAFHTMDKVDRILFERYADIRMIATDPVVCSGSSMPKQITERLLDFQNAHSGYASISFFDMNRVMIADTSGEKLGKQHKFMDFWKDIADGKEFVVNLHKSISLNEAVIHFVRVVRDKNGVPSGVVVTRTPVEELSETMEVPGDMHATNNFNIELIDKNGLIIYSNIDKEAILNKVSTHLEIINKSLSPETMAGALAYTDPKKSDGEEILVFARQKSYREHKGDGWTLLIEIPTKVAFAPAAELRNKVIVTMFIFGCPTLLFIYLSSRKISQSIEKMTIAADEVAKGNLDVRVNASSKDEIGRLSVAFNKMVDDLKQNRDSLLAYNRELETKVAERTVELEKEFAKREKAEAELEKSRRLEAIGSLAGGIAHDFNNLLTAILGNIAITKMHMNSDNKDFDKLTNAENACMKATELTQRIITFSKGGDPILNPVSISEIASEIVCPMMSGSDITCECVFPEHLYPVYVDEGQIRQVLRNMAINAKEAMPHGGVIRVDAENITLGKGDIAKLKEGKYVKVSIKDSGKGIPEEILPKIFDPYFTTKAMGAERGLGLGLAVCYSIVKKHNGHIAVESKTGEGTTFHVYLPASEIEIKGRESLYF